MWVCVLFDMCAIIRHAYDVVITSLLRQKFCRRDTDVLVALGVSWKLLNARYILHHTNKLLNICNRILRCFLLTYNLQPRGTNTTDIQHNRYTNTTNALWWRLLTHWAETKWQPFSKRNFQMHFREWKYVNFIWYFIECCSSRSNQQYSINGSDNGLASSSRQPIIWTIGGWFTDAYMRHSASVS